MMRSLAAAAFTLAALTIATPSDGGAQTADTVPPRAGFVGKVWNPLDSTGVRSADIRLMFVDSVRKIATRSGGDSLEIFVDTLRSRVGITDSVGNFTIRQLRAGRYLMEVRRIGFAPLNGVVVVDTTVLSTVLSMDVVSRLLATVKSHRGLQRSRQGTPRSRRLLEPLPIRRVGNVRQPSGHPAAETAHGSGHPRHVRNP
jgi:hypothetical protein